MANRKQTIVYQFIKLYTNSNKTDWFSQSKRRLRAFIMRNVAGSNPGPILCVLSILINHLILYSFALFILLKKKNSEANNPFTFPQRLLAQREVMEQSNGLK